MPDDASSSTCGGPSAARPQGRKFRIEILISSAAWPGDVRPLVRDCARAALAAACPAGLAAATLSIELAEDARVAELNSRWRGKDGPTNVLSFPGCERGGLADALAVAGPAGPPVMLGDVILAHGVCAREAAAAGVHLRDHLALLVVHGCLHCLGYDHVDEGEAEEMEGLEARILGRLGIDDPRLRDAAGEFAR